MYENYEVAYPFIVCNSINGPYDDMSFAAGCQFGEVMSECKLILPGHQKEWIVYAPLLPQIDLLAMYENLVVDFKVGEAVEEDWVHVILRRI